MLAKSGMDMAIGVTWLIAALFFLGTAWNLRQKKRIFQILCGISLSACFLGAAFLLAIHAFLYVGTFLTFLCSVLLLMDTTMHPK